MPLNVARALHYYRDMTATQTQLLETVILADTIILGADSDVAALLAAGLICKVSKGLRGTKLGLRVWLTC